MPAKNGYVDFSAADKLHQSTQSQDCAAAWSNYLLREFSDHFNLYACTHRDLRDAESRTGMFA
ncbi:MAG: hypothetical protein ACREDP_25360, partial [Bradyrhizobium sp.]